MAQYQLNTPIGARLSPVINTNATTTINLGTAAVLAGFIATSAGSAWTITFYNGAPGSGGVALGPAIAVTAGFIPLIEIRAAQGLYAVTAGTTAGSLQVAYY